MYEQLLRRLTEATLSPGAPESQILAAEVMIGRPIPPDLSELVRQHDGICGSLANVPYEGMWFAFYPISEWAQTTVDYEFDGWLPDGVIVGTNGGGEAIVMEAQGSDTRYWLVPFISISREDMLPLGSSVEELFDGLASASCFFTAPTEG